MTEESYQQARKVMQRINHLRGLITKQKGEVAKWSRIEDTYRMQLNESQADGAKKCLVKAQAKLTELLVKFWEMKFPENNIKSVKQEAIQCEWCGNTIDKGSTYCTDCLGA